MYNTKSKFHKGSSVLVSTLITAAASAMIGYGITKMIATGIDSINNQQVKMQAQQYAASRINVLRSVRYDNLAGMTKRQIGTTDYYEEVTKTGDSDGSTGDAYQVAIYKGADSSNPVTTMNFYRSNPGILLDNQVESASGNADSSALIQSALKDYTNSQFGEGSESESSSKAMGIKSFTSYVDGLLSKYRINAVAAWNIDSNNTFNQNGSDRKPIYIDKGSRYNYAAQGSVTYSMSGNSEGYLATVTKGSNGLFYIDYTEKDENTETGSGTTKPGGSVGGNDTIPEAETILKEWKGNRSGLYIDNLGFYGLRKQNYATDTYNITIPKGVTIIKLYGESQGWFSQFIGPQIYSYLSNVKNDENDPFDKKSKLCNPYPVSGDVFGDFYAQITVKKTDTKYIKVTPEKKYKWRYFVGIENSDNPEATTFIKATYSKSINTHTPDIVLE